MSNTHEYKHPDSAECVWNDTLGSQKINGLLSGAFQLRPGRELLHLAPRHVAEGEEGVDENEADFVRPIVIRQRAVKVVVAEKLAEKEVRDAIGLGNCHQASGDGSPQIEYDGHMVVFEEQEDEHLEHKTADGRIRIHVFRQDLVPGFQKADDLPHFRIPVVSLIQKFVPRFSEGICLSPPIVDGHVEEFIIQVDTVEI